MDRPAITFIKENVDKPEHLCDAVLSRCRYILKKPAYKYTVEELAKEYDTLKQFTGVGKASIARLQAALKEHGYT